MYIVCNIIVLYITPSTVVCSSRYQQKNDYLYYPYVCEFIGRDRDIDLPVDETIVDVIAPFKDTKEPVEMTIGDGMEFTIPGTFI